MPRARVAATDTASPPEASAQRERLAAAGVEIHLDTDGTQLLAGSEAPRTLVKSPGVPNDAPVVVEARRRGIAVVGELELGWRMLPNHFVAVTGTNGKTTTSELLGAIYRAAGRAVEVAGNVGTPLTALAGRIDGAATVVCEASSFQLEDSSCFAPEVALFLNFSADHLDRHQSIDAYLAAKLRVFANQGRSDVAVLNAAEPALAGADLGYASPVWFGEDPRCDLRLTDDVLYWRGRPLMGVHELQLHGAHNVQDAMGAAAAALVDDVDPDAVREGLRSFKGLPHRMELVRELGGVAYVNDSKATNVAAAAAALDSFPGGVHAILGGSLKGGDFVGLEPAVRERCKRCYLIGEAAPRLMQDLVNTRVELVQSGDLERAVAEASRRARRRETVLLAPACASFDQFDDYAARGERFRELVEALPERQ
jgi:UDP-N-acetylmuramoylalanine--D-glutamate ligase